MTQPQEQQHEQSFYYPPTSETTTTTYSEQEIEEMDYYATLQPLALKMDESFKDGKLTVHEVVGMLMAFGIMGAMIAVKEGGGQFDDGDRDAFTAALNRHYSETFTKYDLPGMDAIWDYVLTTHVLPGVSKGVQIGLKYIPNLPALTA